MSEVAVTSAAAAVGESKDCHLGCKVFRPSGQAKAWRVMLCLPSLQKD